MGKMRTPWLYETQTPMTDPPNINYRKIIIEYQENCDWLLKDRRIHLPKDAKGISSETSIWRQTFLVHILARFTP